MQTTIKYYQKNVYGKDLMYLADPVYSDTLQIISGRRTITQRDMLALNMIGFEFVEVLESEAKSLREGK